MIKSKDNIALMYEESLEFGIAYNASTNQVIRAKTNTIKAMAECAEFPESLKKAWKDDQNYLSVSQFSNRSRLEKLTILIQNGCNLNCRYCYADGGTYRAKPTHLTETQGDEIIRILCNSGINCVEEITFFGGEPSKYPSVIRAICESCSTLTDAGKLQSLPRFYMITNCTDISKECIEVIQTFDIRLTVSLDGPQFINDKLRLTKDGHGTYSQILKNLALLKENGIRPAMIEATYTTIHEQYGFSRQDTIKGIRDCTDGLDVYLCDCRGCELSPQHDFTLEAGYLQGINLDLLFKNRDFTSISLDVLDLVYNIAIALNTINYCDYFCNAGVEAVCITWNGDIYPCQMFIGSKSFMSGNIFDCEFSLDCFNALSTTMKSFTKSSIPSCSTCWVKSFCKTCTYMVYSAMKSEKEKEYLNKICLAKQNLIHQIILYLYNMENNSRKEFYKSLSYYMQYDGKYHEEP